MIAHVSSTNGIWPLFGTQSTRGLELDALASAAPHALMEAAGLSVARLALAVAPHGHTVWIAAGPGNNGGDGLVAGRHLHQAGKRVRVSLVGDAEKLPSDALHALQQARQAGVPIESGLPTRVDCELGIDALLGLGARRAPTGGVSHAIGLLNQCGAPVLAVDLPSGMCGDTGVPFGADVVNATHTLALLTLKPGLFTAQGRDLAGTVWLDTVGVEVHEAAADANLLGQPPWPARRHVQHKGSFGDVLIVGGARGMEGAAVLAASSALTAGAGRVYVAILAGDPVSLAGMRPELMPRSMAQALTPQFLRSATVVCGCGGGETVREHLPAVLKDAARLVLDADALNAIAADSALASAVQQRSAEGLATVLTPHPLEAARLLQITTTEVQADRIGAAREISARMRAGVLLKGSGTVIAFDGSVPSINPTGNARLGTAGSGDVLAGWTGGLWAQQAQTNGRSAAEASTWIHGRAVESGDLRLPLRAADLIEEMAKAVACL